MRSTVKAGLLLSVMCFCLSSKQASAVSINSLITSKQIGQSAQTAVAAQPEKVEPKVEAPIIDVAPKPIEHIILAGESLASIAEQNSTTWSRIYNKNPQISDPNIIAIDQVISIPFADEVLAPRTPPEAPVAPAPKASLTRAKTPVKKTAAQPSTSYSSAGNTYSYGYCTWYAKSRRPDLPNSLGNAATWVSRAAAAGYATGTEPRAGAIGQQGNHVVYVEAVNGDGTILISEMNYAGFNVISSRVASAGSFTYIY